MRRLYFDCVSGISGDMCLGALLALGADELKLREQLALLGLNEYALSVESIKRSGIVGKNVDVHVQEPVDDRHYSNIKALIQSSGLKPQVKKMSIDIFEAIAEAEAAVHGEPMDQIHFHEVGAVDSIIDIVGFSILVDLLAVDEIHFSVLTDGTGTINCQHGVIPVPVPAVVKMLENSAVQFKTDSTVQTELVTPTGMGIAKATGNHYGDMQPMHKILGVGYGFGNRDIGRLNALRVVLGEVNAQLEAAEVTVIETNIDDANPEWIGYTLEKLMVAGALDAYVTPLYMKKNRPAMQLGCIVPCGQEQPYIRLMLENTTTFGLRMHRCQRVCMDRQQLTIDTAFGPVLATKATYDGIIKIAPEYESCKAAAEKSNVPVKAVYEAVLGQAGNGKDKL